jgi:HEAT repeat protein
MEMDVTQALLDAGKEISCSTRAEIVARGARAVDALVKIVEDDSLLYEDAPGGGWAPIHAVDILAELGAEEGIESMLRLLPLTDALTIIHDRVILALGKMGPRVLEPALESYARNQDLILQYPVRAGRPR